MTIDLEKVSSFQREAARKALEAESKKTESKKTTTTEKK